MELLLREGGGTPARVLVRRALRGRAVRATDMNARSSRSHGVLQLLLEQSPTDARVGAALRARLSFVDLAGSERVSGAAPSLERQHRNDGDARHRDGQPGRHERRDVSEHS